MLQHLVGGLLIELPGRLFIGRRFRIYSRRRDILRLFMVAVLENFGYRQLNTLWRCRGMWQWLSRRKHNCGLMQRSGSWGQR